MNYLSFCRNEYLPKPYLQIKTSRNLDIPVYCLSSKDNMKVYLALTLLCFYTYGTLGRKGKKKLLILCFCMIYFVSLIYPKLE